MTKAAKVEASQTWSAGEEVELGEERSLYLHRRGDGPTVVLIHGALVDCRDWMMAADAAGLAGRLIAIDRPGHGRSRRPRFEAGPHEQAAQIRAALLAIGVERAVIVGHSMGGAVALAYAADFPESVAGLLLAAPIAFPEFRPVEHTYLAPRAAPVSGPVLASVARMSTDVMFWPLVRRLMFSPHSPPGDWIEAYPTEKVTRPEKMVGEGEDSAALLPGSPAALIDFSRIRAPVRVIYGARDKIVDPSRHAERLASVLPKAAITRVEDAGHMVHHAAPVVLARELAALLADAG
jgi:pimeloyl-ACP methyl ester carboxylesterase